jgi:hypothetical protein
MFTEARRGVRSGFRGTDSGCELCICSNRFCTLMAGRVVSARVAWRAKDVFLRKRVGAARALFIEARPWHSLPRSNAGEKYA